MTELNETLSHQKASDPTVRKQALGHTIIGVLWQELLSHDFVHDVIDHEGGAFWRVFCRTRKQMGFYHESTSYTISQAQDTEHQVGQGTCCYRNKSAHRVERSIRPGTVTGLCPRAPDGDIYLLSVSTSMNNHSLMFTEMETDGHTHTHPHQENILRKQTWLLRVVLCSF